MTELKIGLEAETFVVDGNGIPIVIPGRFPQDGFPLLMEFRADPGATIGEVVANFMKVWINQRNDFEIYCKQNNIEAHIERTSFLPVPIEAYRKAVSAMGGCKEPGQSRNIYNINLDEFNDVVLSSEGKITHRYVSAGLHIHFSANYTVFTQTPNLIEKRKKDKTVYSIDGYKTVKVGTLSALEPKLIVHEIVRRMDERLYPTVVDPEMKRVCKYRQPGFYELKPWGFEYRSLPFSGMALDNLSDIVKFAFDTLREVLER
jgi:hypothetical protein